MSLPQNPSKSFIARNPHIYGVGAAERQNKLPVLTQPKAQSPAPDAPKRCRRESGQRQIKLNKLETRFYNWYRGKYPDHWISAQAITLRLGFDCRYTPDFWVKCPDSAVICAYEVKGPRFWDDAKVKLKVAASMYPFFLFKLVTWNDGQWQALIIRQ